MNKLQYKFRIAANKKLCLKFYKLSLDAAAISRSIGPGQFLHIRVTDGLVPFFRRPFSVHRAKENVEILYEVVGPGTQILSAKKPGEYVDVLGPLGHGFTLPPKGTKRVVMIAGGVGVAPFMILSDVLARKGYELSLFYGGRCRDHIFDMKEFENNGCKIFLSTNDGSVGKKGYVTTLFSKIKIDPKTTMMYACGPRPMMAAVQKFTQKHGFRCEGSFEEVMACGLGACLGCSIKTTSGYKTVCHDGPVFDIRNIVFEK